MPYKLPSLRERRGTDDAVGAVMPRLFERNLRESFDGCID